PCPISAVPRDTASNTSRAGTSSPAAYTLMVSRPLLISLTSRAKRSAPTPTPGKFLGQDVTIFQEKRCCWVVSPEPALDVSCLQPASAVAARPTPAAVRMSRRFMGILPACCYSCVGAEAQLEPIAIG